MATKEDERSIPSTQSEGPSLEPRKVHQCVLSFTCGIFLDKYHFDNVVDKFSQTYLARKEHEKSVVHETHVGDSKGSQNGNTKMDDSTGTKAKGF